VKILLLVVVGLLFVATVILKKLGIQLGPPARAEEESPYDAKSYFFTKAENSFYRVLLQAVGSDYVVFAKVKLSDMIQVRRGTSNRQPHLNRINSKHADFLLCGPEQFQPRVAIELDDASHQSVRRQRRDDFVNRAFASARLPLLRVRAKRGYSPQELRQRIAEAVRGTPKTATPR